MVPAGASNDDIVESADEWYAKASAAASKDASGESGGVSLPESMREGNAV